MRRRGDLRKHLDKAVEPDGEHLQRIRRRRDRLKDVIDEFFVGSDDIRKASACSFSVRVGGRGHAIFAGVLSDSEELWHVLRIA